MTLHASSLVFRYAINGLRIAVSWFWDFLARLLVLPTYRRSHAKWIKRNSLGARWTPLWDGIEYDISIPHQAYAEPRRCQVAFRAVGTHVRTAEMVLEVRGAGLRYQEHIRLHEINNAPIVLFLGSVPQLDVRVLRENVRFTVEEYVFLAGKLILADGTERKHEASLLCSLTQNWLFNDEWVSRWGVWWNCSEVVHAKRSIAEYWNYRFGYRTWVSFVLGNTLGTPVLASIQFWAGVCSGIFVLSENGKLVFRWRACE